MNSMTGFGQSKGETASWSFTVVVRTVNHRHLDTVFRLRGVDPGFESELRDRIKSVMRRGRVEMTIDAIPRMDQLGLSLKVDQEAVRKVRDFHDVLQQQGLISSGLNFSDLLSISGLVEVLPPEETWDLESIAQLESTAGQALSSAAESRAREGTRLRAVMDKRILKLKGLVHDLAQRRSDIQETIFLKLKNRLRLLAAETEFDEARLHQEAAILIDKSDIAEELDRLNSHLHLYDEIRDQRDPVGKRLDFLAQEILRELNTVGSKSRDIELTRLVMDAKVYCEQLREQVQNVE